MKKIIHVVYECTPGSFRGGVQKVAYELALFQSRQGENVEIWTLDNDINDKVTYENGLTIRYFKGFSFLGVKGSFELISSLYEIKDEICAIHSHNTFHILNYQVYKFCRKNKITSVFQPHGALDSNLFNKLNLQSLKKIIYIKLFESKILNNCHAVFALTEKEREQVLKLSDSKNIIVVPNGIRYPESTFSVSGGKLNDGFRFLYIGRIVEKKGLHDFIVAFSKFLEQHPSSEFFIVGDSSQFPSYTQRLKQMISNFQIDKKVVWYGFADESEKKELFRTSDIFIHASYSEGMPMAVLEAMAHNQVCLVTEGCYMAGAADNHSLYQVSQGDSALYQGALELFNDKELFLNLRRNSHQYIKKNHCWEKLARKTIEIYNS